MAWTTPRTWSTGEVVTSTIMNTHVRDNLTDLDRRTTSTAATVSTSQTTTSTSYTDLATTGPAVTVTIGSTGKALVSLYGLMLQSNASQASFMGFAVSGATTVAAADAFALALNAAVAGDAIRCGATWLVTGLNSGSTTGTAKYRVTANTGTYQDRHIIWTPLGS